MKFKLINMPNNNYNAKEQILINRGIKESELSHYMNLTNQDINPPSAFGEELMQAAATCYLKHLDAGDTICMPIDCDCDGYTSGAYVINFTHDLTSTEYVENHVFWYMHEGKQHGLSDCIEWIKDCGPELVIIPDAGSNDKDQLEELERLGIDVIILDHHEIEITEWWNTLCHPHLFLINSQLPQYPNKDLSGVGVVYQFCRFVSQVRGLEDKHIEDWYLDLVALGLDGDMMSLQSFETRRLITRGLKPENIRNPFIYEMWQKNKFKLGDTPTAWGATFYIVPLVNAITRSGTLEEKELIFKSMLTFKAFEQTPSNKRGHKPGETERLVDQAIRTCTNVKNRQTRAEEAGLELVEHLIKDNDMMKHKVLLFLLEPGSIKSEIRGLIANKLMAKYQRPCCMLTKREDVENGIPYIVYEGSARGCDKVGVTEFKNICAETHLCQYTIGHQGAFGLGLSDDNVAEFLRSTDSLLKDMSSEPIYYVDYIWDAAHVDPKAILDIADMSAYWGKDCDEALVAIKGLKITSDMITMMASNTVKISLPNGVSIIKFRMPDEEYDQLYSKNGYVEIDAVCRCNRNEWNGNVSAQLLLDDYSIVGRCAYVF